MIYTHSGVIYTRYSSHAQRDVSIEQQLRACRAFADRHDICIVGTYEDRALTGTSDKRPGFQRMISDAKAGAWDYVIVYTLDRFARDRYDSAVYKRQLKNCGVKVLSAMENISDDPTGILMESLLEGLAEYYSKELSRKVTRGLEDNARRCMVTGALPLGYVKGEDDRYAICEKEADTVREIFRRILQGESFAKIIEDLNARGIRTKTGKLWKHSSLNRLLSNERYTGIYIYRDIRIPGGIPAIIDREQFDDVQALLHSKPNPRKDRAGRLPQKRRRDNGTYLLTGKLFCGHCHEPMIGLSGTSHTDAPHFYYTCKGRRSGTQDCTKRNARRDYVETVVATALRDIMLTDQAIQILADSVLEYQANLPANEELKLLKAELAEADRALSNLLSAVESGFFSPTVQNRLAELEAKKHDLTCAIAAAKADSAQQLSRNEIIAALELFQNGDINDKNHQELIFDTFLIAAYLYDDRVKIVFNFEGEKDTTIPFDIDEVDLSPVRISQFGGAEGNRTPVRKQLGKNFSGRSLLFTFPHPIGNKHPMGISSFMMHGTRKA